jgi:hypothetical protein
VLIWGSSWEEKLFETKKRGQSEILDPDSLTAFKLVAPTRDELLCGVAEAEVRSKLISTGLGDELVDMVLRLAQR